MASSAELGGRVAVVTGASGGIGAAVSRLLVEHGAEVWMVARNRERLERAADAAGGHVLVADVSEPLGADEIAAAAGDSADILVNAAGSFDLAPVADTTPDLFARMIAGNLTGAFLAIRALLPGMLDRGRGDIVTIGSVAGRKAFPGNGAYSAAKFGVRGLHAVLDEELRGSGVRASLVEPAATDTPIWDPLDPDNRQDLPPRSAMLQPGRVAEAVIHIITRTRDVRMPVVAVERS